MTDPTDVGVVILTFGAAPAVPLLTAQLDAEGIPSTSIVVVRNEAPGLPFDAGQLPDGATSINLAGNRGYAAGMNAGIRNHLAAGHRWILLLTQDAGILAGSARIMIDAADGAAGYGVLGPVVGWAGSDRVFSYGGVSNASGDIDHLRKGPPPPTDPGVTRCDWIDGAVMLLRAEMLDGIGLLDESFFLYFEDTEFCLRARRAGWKVGVVLDARSEESPGGEKRPGAYAYLHARNGLEYARLSAGMPGVGKALRRHLRELRAAVRRLAMPSTPNRGEQWVRLWCEWRGVIDFARRRRGAPPPALPGRGDLG